MLETIYYLSTWILNIRKNICSLASEGVHRIDISAEAIFHYIPPELQYCCRYWTWHLAQCKDPMMMMKKASFFLQEHFLHWAEVLCILGYASEIKGGIERLQSAFKESKISPFLEDARRFIFKCQHIADIVPLQLYSSGLIFTPEKSILRRRFDSEIPKWIFQLPKVEEYWSAELQTLEGHDNSVTSVAFSPVRQWLASGSWDKTIKLWDPASGTLQQTLNLQGIISEVNFAADGSYLEAILGAFDIGVLHNSESPTHSQDSINVCISISGQGWIALRGNKVLWLPPAYRPERVTIRHGRLAMGHASGRVSFFQFY